VEYWAHGQARDDKEAVMSKAEVVLARICGSVAGSFIGSVSLGVLVGPLALYLALVCCDGMMALAVFGSSIGLSLLIGTVIGAAGGAAVVTSDLNEEGSFWTALSGALIGLLLGGLPPTLCLWGLHDIGKWHTGWLPFLVPIACAYAGTIAGGVIGSGLKAKLAIAAKGALVGFLLGWFASIPMLLERDHFRSHIVPTYWVPWWIWVIVVMCVSMVAGAVFISSGWGAESANAEEAQS
jgi:hypothetical protein